jgi:DNA-binding MarR family transcriptional regulator
MLFDRQTLAAIARGEVTTAFRIWRRPTVRAGGRLLTSIGQLAIDAVTPVEIDSISQADARRSGAEGLEALLSGLSGRGGQLYRIDFRLAGPDPRAALAIRPATSSEDRTQLDASLAHLDRVSRTGPWTSDILRLIEDCPGMPARLLAEEQGVELPQFKRRVRRLKALGLTESLQNGYRLTPRGRERLRTIREAPEFSRKRDVRRDRR